MRILIDLQGAQSSGSRFRGIGRYSLAFAQAMVRQAGEHEIWLALNGRFADTVEPLRASFDGLIPQERIRVFEIPGPTAEIDPANAWRARAAERVREAFLADLRPDIVHISSLFEGLSDDAVTSVGEFERAGTTSVTLYDLIPYLNQQMYLVDERIKRWYFRKLQALKNADLWLAISESSRREAVEHLHLPAGRVINVSTGLDPSFRPVCLRPDEKRALLHRYNLEEPFILYTCGYDYRKNVEGLIEAFSLLPGSLINRFRLALAGTIQEPHLSRLKQLAMRLGLPYDRVIFTGFVPDDDLILLYNACHLCVYPSLYEGFGLPALEAMACGAAVIGSDTTGIPEVIGRADALFDPANPRAVANKMAQALTDEGFRRSLREYGPRQAKNFSWDASGKRALEAFEVIYRERKREEGQMAGWIPRARPRLAFVSPVPPAKSGIADYSAEILPELSRYYEIEIVSEQPGVSDPWLEANFPLRSLEWFAAHDGWFDRVLYQFGNSTFHSHMFSLLLRHPGVVVLHDFFLSGVLSVLEGTGEIPQGFLQGLYVSHGYPALIEERAKGREKACWTYPANLWVLAHALGVIVHSRHAIDLAQSWYGLGDDRFRVIPQVRALPTVDRQAARARLGLQPDDFLVCSFGMLVPTKTPERILAAWLDSALARDERCKLVFVGETDGDYGQKLSRRIVQKGLSHRIQITGFAPPDLFRDYLSAADVAVQLRTMSRGESSRAALDCLAHGVPLIVNAHGFLAELPEAVVIKLDDSFTDQDLTDALEMLWQEPKRREGFSVRAREFINNYHAPNRIAEQYVEAIEAFFGESTLARGKRLVLSLANINAPVGPAERDLMAAALCVHGNRQVLRLKQILLDVSILVRHDAGTGIQRVTKAILSQFLIHPPAGYRIEPVYSVGGSYRYARAFTLRFLGLTAPQLLDDPVDVAPGDVFLGLDLAHHDVTQSAPQLLSWRNIGVKVAFIIYDLLPVLRPDRFSPEFGPLHQHWLETIAHLADTLVCISRSVAEELEQWLEEHPPANRRPLTLRWFWLGADLANSRPSTGLPPGAQEILAELGARPTFLMVGTVEPRKGHAQSLTAFEQLWDRGIDVNLTIVGKEGWMVEDLVRRLRSHPERGRRLFWLEGTSDEYLEHVYESSAVLLAASEGEGFGLPLVEAAQHGLPIIARDIPVFREVAGDHAFYFKGLSAEALRQAIEEWLDLYRRGKHPRSDGLTWLTWEQSAERLMEIILDDVGNRLDSPADAEQEPADVAAAADRSFPEEQHL